MYLSDLYSPCLEKVNWAFVDGIVFETAYALELFERRYGAPKVAVSAGHGIEPHRFSYRKHTPSLSIACVSPLTAAGNPSLLVQIAAALAKTDPDYRIHVAGDAPGIQVKTYLEHATRSLGIGETIQVDAGSKSLDSWLEDKDYVLSTSIAETSGRSVFVGMAKGLKPVVHNWPGAARLFNPDALFNDVESAIERITQESLHSQEHRDFVLERYGARKQSDAVEDFLVSVLKTPVGQA